MYIVLGLELATLSCFRIDVYIVLGLELATLSCLGITVYISLGLELAVLSFLIPYLPTSAFLYCVFKKKCFV